MKRAFANLMRSVPIAAGLALLCSDHAALSQEVHRVTGTVTIEQTQIAMIGSAQRGKGWLRYHGKTYPFDIDGLGVGGIGISKLTATGDVYDLNTLSDFEGIYGQARIGWAVAQHGGGYRWLGNPKGVTLRLKTRRRGLMLATGADAVTIHFSH